MNFLETNMGVDARMLVGVPTELSPEAIKRLSYRLGDAFGSAVLWAYKDEHGSQRPLEIAPTASLPKIFPQVLNVSLRGRYYGLSYERGPMYVYLGLARWLRSNIPGALVFYGNDSEDLFEELTPKREDELWQHFATAGHLPNRQYSDKEHDTPPCDLCEEPTIRNGWGGGYKAWFCPGCGRHWHQRSGEPVQEGSGF